MVERVVGEARGGTARDRVEDRLGDLADAAQDRLEGLAGVAQERLDDLADALRPRLRGVLHEAAFAVSLVTGTALVCLAEPGRERLGALVYALSVSALFGTSAAFHRGRWGPRGTAVMARLDHSMIFVLIAGTYTPFALLLLDGAARWGLLGAVWGGALAGVVTRNALSSPPRWLMVGLYLALGWVALAFLPQLLRTGGVVVLALIALGGVLYSLGAVVYALRRPDPSPRWFGFHEVFHALTVAAFAVHYVAVSVAQYRS